MQIVIDIDENIFTRLFDNGTEDYAIVSDDLFAIAKAIRKGTPLPKGHGRLKDIDWIDDNCENHYSDKDGSWCYAWKDIDNAPTIIEADKEESEEV
jgi:hypothetical protein